MRSLARVFSILIAFPIGAGTSAPPAAAPVDCLSSKDGARAECLKSATHALRELIATNPAEAERLARDSATALVGSGDTATGWAQAELLEIQGLALSRQGRHAEAAAAVRAAVGVDDGATRLTWRSGGDVLWSTLLDPGNGRLNRAAQVLLDAGDTQQARDWLRQSLQAGAGAAARDTWEKTGGGAIGGLDPKPTPLQANEWYPSLPEVAIQLFSGDKLDLASTRGKVLLLDFWASWCAPCLRELPALQGLQDSHQADGLVVVTVNARETRTTAESTFSALGVKLPIGVYDDELERAFAVRTLPTLVLADRDGRIRARWDSRVPDIDSEVRKRVRSLLSGDPDGASRSVADVLFGDGLLKARWTREVSGVVGGAAFLGGKDAKDPTGLAVTAGDQLTWLDAAGRVTRRVKLPGPASARLLPWRDPEGKPRELLSFRAGREDLLRIDAAGAEPRSWKTNEPVLDVAILPSQTRGPRAVVATTSGVGALNADGALSRLAAPSQPCAVGALPDGRVSAATRAGRITWFDASGASTGVVESGQDVCGPMLTKPGTRELGATPSTVRAATVGRFWEAGSWQAVVATGDDQLVVLDLATGAVKFRARWPGVSALGSGDLDGDGRDELLVADGRRIALVERR